MLCTRVPEFIPSRAEVEARVQGTRLRGASAEHCQSHWLLGGPSLCPVRLYLCLELELDLGDLWCSHSLSLTNPPEFEFFFISIFRPVNPERASEAACFR